MLGFYCSTDKTIRIMFVVTVSVIHVRCWLCSSTNHNSARCLSSTYTYLRQVYTASTRASKDAQWHVYTASHNLAADSALIYILAHRSPPLLNLNPLGDNTLLIGIASVILYRKMNLPGNPASVWTPRHVFIGHITYYYSFYSFYFTENKLHKTTYLSVMFHWTERPVALTTVRTDAHRNTKQSKKKHKTIIKAYNELIV